MLRIVLLLILCVFFYSAAFAQYQIEQFNPTQQCELEGGYRCRGNCTDGWSTRCFYDDLISKIESNKSLSNQKSQCYGYVDKSVCEPCRNVYQIDGQDVSCEEFYSSINKKNEECQGCLKSGFAAAG